MITSKDQLGRLVSLPEKPVKIISLVPSQTELLHALGLNSEVCGITKFCVHPQEWIRSKAIIGGTKNINFEKIALLQPDLIIANREENDASQVKKLMQDFPVWVSDIRNLNDACEMIKEISKIVGSEFAGINLIRKIRLEFDLLKKITIKVKCAYLIWDKPILTVGGDTFISSMLEQAGFINVFGDKTRYPEISSEELLMKEPKIIFLSSEPFPYFNKIIEKYRKDFPEINIQLVNGELFSWYGTRLLFSPSYFLSLRGKLNYSN